ncbi:MAG: hypothetical protein HY897_24645 [Deltaproteobacteria bacterium]|nr:hypothetical protein [Deltaproteobacteria bacterium]
MALMLSRAKRTIGAFIFSLLMYTFPSLGGGCNVAEEKDGGAEVLPAEDAGSSDAGPLDYGSSEAGYGPPSCTTDDDCRSPEDQTAVAYCDQARGWCEYIFSCDSDSECQEHFGESFFCDPKKKQCVSGQTDFDGGFDPDADATPDAGTAD